MGLRVLFLSFLTALGVLLLVLLLSVSMALSLYRVIGEFRAIQRMLSSPLKSFNEKALGGLRGEVIALSGTLERVGPNSLTLRLEDGDELTLKFQGGERLSEKVRNLRPGANLIIIGKVSKYHAGSRLLYIEETAYPPVLLGTPLEQLKLFRDRERLAISLLRLTVFISLVVLMLGLILVKWFKNFLKKVKQMTLELRRSAEDIKRTQVLRGLYKNMYN